MSSSNSHQPNSTPQPKISESETPIEKNSDPPTDPNTAGSQENPAEKETLSEEKLDESIKDGYADEEGEEERGLGKVWEEGEKNKEDIVEKCFQATAALKSVWKRIQTIMRRFCRRRRLLRRRLRSNWMMREKKLNDQGRGAEDSGNKENLSGSDNQK
ncbi:hypothetical protein DH2020_026886 [Rehmannia glutinosa]|uniref:Uncharacterized protein n=1 Tax=Rehmannia glutinosa TaxID=99300 RepID=A0ABR0VVV2_REHGL